MGTGTGDRGRLSHAMFVLSLKSKMNGGVGCYLLYDLCLCSVVLFWGGGTSLSVLIILLPYSS